MDVLPTTRTGRLALWLLVPVVLFLVLPVWWLLQLIPDSWRFVNIAVAVGIVVLALASLVTAGVAVVREHERSVLLLVLSALTFLAVVSFAVGEALGGH